MVDLQELIDVPNDGASNFESSEHDKGIQTSALSNNLEENVNNSVRLASDADMVKQVKCSYKPSKPNKPKKNKTTQKRPRLVEEVTIEERETRDEVW